MSLELDEELEVERVVPVKLNEVRVATFLPEGKLGEAEVCHYTVTALDAWRAAQARQRAREGETVAQLFVGGKMVMSDSMQERVSNFEVCWRARGDVLIAGLGVGMILKPLLSNPEVSSVTVVEKSQDVIDLVAPHYADPKLQVVQGDIFSWRPPKGTTYDTLYFDVWADIASSNLDQMARLHQAFKGYKRGPGSWMQSWEREHLKWLRKHGR